MEFTRKFPIGAELTPSGAHFRVWAPASKEVTVRIADGANSPVQECRLDSEADGYFSGHLAGIAAGARYNLKLAQGVYPDPASRFQPDGPHGLSQVIPGRFCAAPQRSLRGFHQRNIRCGGAIYAARLHCPSVERRGSAAVFCADGGIRRAQT